MDISVYNPNGPRASWRRTFRSNRAIDGYGSPGLSPGWTHEYDITLQRDPLPPVSGGGGYSGATSDLVLISANGSAERLSTSTAVSTPYFATFGTLISVGSGQGWDHVTLTWKDGTRFTFTPTTLTSGNLYVLSRITRNTGQSIDLAWDSARRLTSITDTTSSAALLSLSYDGNGHLESAVDVYGRKIVYSFGTAAGSGLTIQCLLQVSQIALASASTPAARYAYSYVGYNGQPLLHTMSMPSPTGTGVSTATINYGAEGKVASLVDANGNQRVYTYSSGSSTQVQVKDAAGNLVQSWTQNFNAERRGTGTTNANNQSDYIYYGDPAHPSKPTTVVSRDGKSSSATYDSRGNMLTSTDARGVLTNYTWDYTNFPLGRLTEVQEGSKAPTTYTHYEPSGLLQSVTGSSPTGSGTVTYSYTYDVLGNVLTVTGPGNNAASTITTTCNYTVDGSYTQNAAVGQALTVTDSLGHSTHYRYDTQGRVTAIADALGNAGAITYNLAGDVLTASGPATGQTGSGNGYAQNLYQYVGGPLAATRLFDESGTQIRQINYAYGPEGETIAVAGGTEPVTNTYDALYRIKTLVDGNNNVTTYNYNTVGNLVNIVSPGGDTITFSSHDAVGRVLQRIDGRGIITNFTYNDTAGALTDVQYPANPSRDIHFDYDSYGRLTNSSDGTGSQSFTYDDSDNTRSVTTGYTGLPSQTISYSYYANGSRASMSTPSGSFSYAYDAAGRPFSVTNPFGETTNWNYGNDNRLLSQTMANGVVATNTYNAIGQTVGIKSTIGSTTLSEFNGITHDGAGNRLSVTASLPGMSALSGATSYSYDIKNQLTGETSLRNGGYSHSFGYDAAGNPTTFRGAGKSYNNQNQLSSGASYVYDGNGNPTTYSGVSFAYDEENKATGFGAALGADYTGAGLRAWKQNNSGTRTYFLYDGLVPVAELDSSGNISTTNTFGANGLVSRRIASTNTSVFYTFDERGNTVQRLDSSGNVLSSHISDAYGATVSSSSTNDPYDGYGAQFGYYTDHETGLVLCTFRYYDPASGRFLTRDPFGYAGGINLYSYVTNNPATLADPLGLCADVDGVISLGASGPLDGPRLPINLSIGFNGRDGSLTVAGNGFNGPSLTGGLTGTAKGRDGSLTLSGSGLGGKTPSVGVSGTGKVGNGSLTGGFSGLGGETPTGSLSGNFPFGSSPFGPYTGNVGASGLGGDNPSLTVGATVPVGGGQTVGGGFTNNNNGFSGNVTFSTPLGGGTLSGGFGNLGGSGPPRVNVGLRLPFRL